MWLISLDLKLLIKFRILLVSQLCSLLYYSCLYFWFFRKQIKRYGLDPWPASKCCNYNIKLEVLQYVPADCLVCL
jgi:hypothetical protein